MSGTFHAPCTWKRTSVGSKMSNSLLGVVVRGQLMVVRGQLMVVRGQLMVVRGQLQVEFLLTISILSSFFTLWQSKHPHQPICPHCHDVQFVNMFSPWIYLQYYWLIFYQSLNQSINQSINQSRKLLK